MGSCVAFGKKLLQELGLTLQRCIDTCQSAETMATQMKPMGGKVDVNVLCQRIKQKKEQTSLWIASTVARNMKDQVINTKCGK